MPFCCSPSAPGKQLETSGKAALRSPSPAHSALPETQTQPQPQLQKDRLRHAQTRQSCREHHPAGQGNHEIPEEFVSDSARPPALDLSSRDVDNCILIYWSEHASGRNGGMLLGHQSRVNYHIPVQYHTCTGSCTQAGRHRMWLTSSLFFFSHWHKPKAVEQQKGCAAHLYLFSAMAKGF